jgi:hypothetical protein
MKYRKGVLSFRIQTVRNIIKIKTQTYTTKQMFLEIEFDIFRAFFHHLQDLSNEASY